MTKLPLNISPLLPVSPRNQTEKLHGKSEERYTNGNSVRCALDDDDREVRFLGVMSFGFIFGQKKPWEPLLPRLEEIASRDADAGIRAEAIWKLWYHEAAGAFLTSLQTSTNQTSPVTTLLGFDSQKPEVRGRWYARAVQILSGKDEALRLQWLTYILGNALNPSTAPMWRIEADPALVDSLRQIERMGSQKEPELASKALLALATSAQPGGAANRSQPIRSTQIEPQRRLAPVADLFVIENRVQPSSESYETIHQNRARYSGGSFFAGRMLHRASWHTMGIQGGLPRPLQSEHDDRCSAVVPERSRQGRLDIRPNRR